MAVLAAAGCGERGDPVRAPIDAIAAAAEKRDAGAVLAQLSADFRASDGSAGAEADAQLRRYFAAYESLDVEISEVSIERAPRAARVAVPGGSARLAGEVRLVPDARPDEEILLQALEPRDAPALLRLGYRRGGRTIRGPVSATTAELQALLALARADPVIGPLLAPSAPAAGEGEGAP